MERSQESPRCCDRSNETQDGISTERLQIRYRGHNVFWGSTGDVVGGDFVMALNTVLGSPSRGRPNGASGSSTIPQ
jgi:hypothetical protein